MPNTSCALGEIVPPPVSKPEDRLWDIIIGELSPEMRSVVDYNTLKAARPGRLFGLELQNIAAETICLARIKDTLYRKALSGLDSLQGQIVRQRAD